MESSICYNCGWNKDFYYCHLEITTALLEQNDSAQNIFGELDAMKVRSCMTLFDLVKPDDVFASVLNRFYNGMKCSRTLKLIMR